MMEQTERISDAMILTFDTASGRARTMTVPNPRAGLSALDVFTAASSIVSSDVFDPELGMSGRLVGLCRAVHERVRTIPLF